MSDGEVCLTKREIAMGAECGIMRNIAALHLADSFGFTEEYGWNAHIEGACGEIAVAKLLGRYWSPSVNTFSAADIGLNIQVRTRSRHDYELYVRERDNPEHVYVLVTGKTPTFVVRGYRLGNEARRSEWLKDHGGRPPAWFVPTSELLPWQNLRYSGEGYSAADDVSKSLNCAYAAIRERVANGGPGWEPKAQ